MLFDIQPDQRTLVDSAAPAADVTPGSYTPIVPMRLLMVKRDSVSAAAAPRCHGAGDAGPTSRPGRWPRRRPARRRDDTNGAPPWALRREYRSTYRGEKNSGERITAGKWFGAGPQGSGRTAEDPVPSRWKSGLATELGLAVGDPVTWNVQGATVYSRVTSLRQVSWARFEPNFFVVFAPGAIDDGAAIVGHDGAAPRTPRRVGERCSAVWPSALRTSPRSISEKSPGRCSHVVDRIVLAIRFMALFSLATGAVVLVGAIATSRWQRVREGTLLRTLGATRAQVLLILCVEYAALGIGGGTGGLRPRRRRRDGPSRKWYFDADSCFRSCRVLLLALGLVMLTTAVGLLNSLEVLRRPPLEVLRAE